MFAKENQVLNAALQFSKAFPEYSPEAVLFGYSKLLTMDENLIGNIISDECMDDIETAHKWFSDNKLDLNLIKSSLLLIMPFMPADVLKVQAKMLSDYLDKEEKLTSSKDILDAAVAKSVIPIKKLFAVGCELKDVLEYSKDVYSKNKRDDESENADESVAQDSSQDSDKSSSDKADKSAKKSDSKKKDDKKDGKKDDKKPEENRSLGYLSRKYLELSAALLDVVKGQDQAVLKFVQGYNHGELLKNTEKDNKPKSYFFFFGPPGVGKTLLAETAADVLGLPHKIFYMSEYATGQSYEELIGISKMYGGSQEGSLTGFVRKNPECLLIFDEIEKAHPAVIRQFLQILGAGKLHNPNQNSVVDFSKATIIFTSNVGRQLYQDRSVNLATIPEKVLIDAIMSEDSSSGLPTLPPELCSRIASGNAIIFNHLSIRQLADMVKTNFDNIVARMEKEYGVKVTYAKELPLLFIYNRGGEIDARVAVGKSEKFLKDEIFELIRQLGSKNVDGNKINAIHIDIDWKGMDPELKRLFKNDSKSEVLVFSDDDNLFDSIDNKKYVVHKASSISEANEMLMNDIDAIYIDPFSGAGSENDVILSISDYNTDGVKFFHEVVEKNVGLPIFMMETGTPFSEVDRRTFLQEGAVGTTRADSRYASSFKRMFTQTMEELYMERESQVFAQQGWVVDYNTKQELSDKDGKMHIMYYNLKKKKAVDVDSRGSILSDAEKPNVRFSDVIGAESAKEELQYFVRYLKNPKQFLMSGERAPKGILLYGPPGTGKTMLAKAMAGECDVTFLQTSASEFKNKYVGESEANVRRLFAKARKYAPSIIFIDEIDAIGKQRVGSEFTASNESILNALLTEMDGFVTADPKRPVFVLAATNFGVRDGDQGISSLDSALMRRFDNMIYVALPKESDRKKYISLMLDKKKINSISEETAQSIAERTTGKSLDVIQKVIDLALREAVKQNREVTDNDLLKALEDYVYGEKKVRTVDYYKKVAIHEVGHAYVSYLGGDKPSYITIESRGNFGGYMQHANKEDKPSYNREEILSLIRTSLAGRAAEYVFFGKEESLNTGASSDLENATRHAWDILCTYGMEENNLMVLSKSEIMSSPLAAEYIAKVNDILRTEMKNTIDIIEKGRDKIQAIADILVKENKLTGKQFEELMESDGNE